MLSTTVLDAGTHRPTFRFRDPRHPVSRPSDASRAADFHPHADVSAHRDAELRPMDLDAAVQNQVGANERGVVDVPGAGSWSPVATNGDHRELPRP